MPRTPQRGTIDSTASGPIEQRLRCDLRGEMEDFERSIGERIGKLKAAFTEREAAVAIGTEQAEQLVEGLKASTAQLEATSRRRERPWRGMMPSAGKWKKVSLRRSPLCSMI